MQYKDFVKDINAMYLFKVFDKETFIKVYKISDFEYNCIEQLFELDKEENIKRIKEYVLTFDCGEEICKLLLK